MRLLPTLLRLWISQKWEDNRLFIKYLIAGIPGTIIALVLIPVFVAYAHWPHPKAVFILGIFAHAIGFLPQKFWTFKDKNWSNIMQEFLKYMTVGIASATGAYFAVKYTERFQELRNLYIFVKLGTDTISTVIIFLASEFFIFIRSKPAQNVS